MILCDICHPQHSQQFVETVCFLPQHGGEGVEAAVFISYKQSFHCFIHVYTLCTQTGRQVAHRNTVLRYLIMLHIHKEMWACICELWAVPVPGSLSSIDSASSQTMSSLLLAPCWAEERGLTSSMVLIRVRVSWRWRERHTHKMNSPHLLTFCHCSLHGIEMLL